MRSSSPEHVYVEVPPAAMPDSGISSMPGISSSSPLT